MRQASLLADRVSVQRQNEQNDRDLASRRALEVKRSAARFEQDAARFAHGSASKRCSKLLAAAKLRVEASARTAATSAAHRAVQGVDVLAAGAGEPRSSFGGWQRQQAVKHLGRRAELELMLADIVLGCAVDQGGAPASVEIPMPAC